MDDSFSRHKPQAREVNKPQASVPLTTHGSWLEGGKTASGLLKPVSNQASRPPGCDFGETRWVGRHYQRNRGSQVASGDRIQPASPPNNLGPRDLRAILK